MWPGTKREGLLIELFGSVTYSGEQGIVSIGFFDRSSSQRAIAQLSYRGCEVDRGEARQSSAQGLPSELQCSPFSSIQLFRLAQQTTLNDRKRSTRRRLCEQHESLLETK